MYKNYFILFFLVYFFVMPINTLATLLCKVTPNIINTMSEPISENKTNNLRRKPGGSFIADGKNITIKGRVIDESCMPITNASITIWHTNSYGFYQHKIDEKKPDIKLDKNFMGIGKTYSDNNGHYNFLTIMPGEHDNFPPYINLFVIHDDFDYLETKIIFQGNKNNKYFIDWHEIPNEIENFITAKLESQNQNGEDIYIFEIVLPGNNKYKKY